MVPYLSKSKEKNNHYVLKKNKKQTTNGLINFSFFAHDAAELKQTLREFRWNNNNNLTIMIMTMMMTTMMIMITTIITGCAG